MTEQEKSSAVVDETGRAWKPRHSQLIPRKSKNGAALVLSAVAIAIAPAAGIGLYGWGNSKQPRKRKPAMRWRRN